MSDDIVARLRTGRLDERLLCAAADEIERLRRMLLATENEVDIYRILLEKKEKEC